MPLEALAPLADERRVLLFDQLGSGESSRPDEPSLWTVETFVEQVQSVRDGLGLDEIHLFGSSWGGMLALEYAFTRPDGLASLILNSTPTSAPRWAVETLRLHAELPRGLDDKQAEEEFKPPPHLPARSRTGGSRARASSSARRSTRQCGARTSSPSRARSRSGT